MPSVALRYAEEVISARDLLRPLGRDPAQREIGMAEQLIAVFEDDFRRHGDRSRSRHLSKKKEPASLLEALQVSLTSTEVHEGVASVASE